MSTGSAQRGAALAIGLVLLLVLTLLSLTGMRSASTELVMAGNEQYRHNAANAAGAGVEHAIAMLARVPASAAAPPLETPRTLLPGSTIDGYTTSARHVGIERGLPQSSADKFVGVHFLIESHGESARNTRDEQVQGVLVITSAGAVDPVGQIGTGLE